MTDVTDLEFPEDLDQQIEAALETIRAQLLDPDAPPPPGRMLAIIMHGLFQLLEKVSPAGRDLKEAGVIVQAVGLQSVIYFVSQFTPGDWFRETTTDIKRGLIAIELLNEIAKKEDAEAAAKGQ